jgi:hypothetical protein
MARARGKHVSPTLTIKITEAQHAKAVASHSGACLIADAIEEQYPALSRVMVDMATVRATDSERGERYIYLTPPAAQHVLLAYDQGWPHTIDQVIVKRAVQIVPVLRGGKHSAAATAERRAERISRLEAKEQTTEGLTTNERRVLRRARNAPPPVERPSAYGPATIKDGPGGALSTVIGGRPPVLGPAHPNLLRGRNRHFGAKLADPGVAFNEAVEAAVAERLAER